MSWVSAARTSTTAMKTRRPRPPWSPSGRTLHLIDVENLVGEFHADSERVVAAAIAYGQAVWVGPSDHVTVAAHPSLLFAASTAWPGARLLAGHGPDGADLALLSSVTDVTGIAERFAKVILGSGDGIFGDFARTCRLHGVDVGVVACQGSLSDRLRRAASFVRLLPDGGAPTTPPLERPNAA